MRTEAIKHEITVELEHLSVAQQMRLLEFARALRQSDSPQGIPGEVLVQRLENTHIAPEDLDQMRRIIEEDFEYIDPDDWK